MHLVRRRRPTTSKGVLGDFHFPFKSEIPEDSSCVSACFGSRLGTLKRLETTLQVL